MTTVEERKAMLALEVAVTVSKERSAWGTLALEGVCSLGVSGATPDAKSALSGSPSNHLSSAIWRVATGSRTRRPTAGEGGGRMVKGLFIPQVPATQRCACAPGAANKHPSAFTLAHAQSPFSPQATAHYLARGMGLGK